MMNGSESEESLRVEEGGASLPNPEEIKASVVQPRRKVCDGFFVFIGVLTVGALAMIIGLAVGLSGRDGGGSQVSPSTGGGSPSPPASNPSPSPPARRSTFGDVTLWLEEQGVGSLAVADSPQQKAASWMAEMDPLNLEVPENQGLGSILGYSYMERYVLALLYYGLDGSNWKFNYNFLSDDPICSWSDLKYNGATYFLAGVVCDAGGNVVELNFGTYGHGHFKTLSSSQIQVSPCTADSNRLKGSIPAEIGLLTKLEELHMSFNFLNGHMPTSLCLLKNLNSLTIGKNQMNGPLHACIGNDLPKLGFLFLSDNQFGGKLPDTFANLQNLNYVFLDGNMLSGDIIGVADAWPNLVELYAEDNLFTGNFTQNSFQGKALLKQVDLSENQLGGRFPTAILDNNFIETIDLHDNLMFGQIPNELPTRPSLQFLALQKNTFEGNVPSGFANFPNLFHLDLHNNAFTGNMGIIGDLKKLEYLFLANNPFQERAIPGSFKHLTKLQEFSVKGTNRVGEIPTYLGTFTDLKLLDLDNNNLSGPIPNIFQNMTKLEFLLLNRNKNITGGIPESFESLTKLRALFLEKTGVTGSLQPVCQLATFKEAKGDDDGDELLIADCKGENAPIACPCCTTCCEVGQLDQCNTHDQVASLLPQWETLYKRVDYQLGNNTRFVNSDA